MFFISFFIVVIRRVGERRYLCFQQLPPTKGNSTKCLIPETHLRRLWQFSWRHAITVMNTIAIFPLFVFYWVKGYAPPLLFINYHVYWKAETPESENIINLPHFARPTVILVATRTRFRSQLSSFSWKIATPTLKRHTNKHGKVGLIGVGCGIKISYLANKI